MGKFEWSAILTFLAGAAILATFGIDHAGESVIIAIVSPLVFVTSIALGVVIIMDLAGAFKKDENAAEGSHEVED